MALLRSGENLIDKTKYFFENSEIVTIYSPYIKIEKLVDLLGVCKCQQIIVRWQLADILNEVTDFEKLFKFCESNDIRLFRNQKIHLKLIQNQKNKAILGSANFTNMGFGLSTFNLEANTEIETLNFEDLTYLQKIIESSDYVDEVYFQSLKKEIDELRKHYIKSSPLKDSIKPSFKKEFLISSLPMSTSPEYLWDIYSGPKDKFNRLDLNCAIHDLALYDLKPNLNKESFLRNLKTSFNKHPFIVKLKNSIINDKRKSKGYGQVVSWIQNNTTTVPTPRSWELKKEEVVNILYEWICYFDNRFYWDRPKHSQVIHYYVK